MPQSGEDLASSSATQAETWSVHTGYSIAALLAQDQAGPSIPKLEQLISRISQQPADFKTGWNFDGTLYFVSNLADLPHRDVLIALFEALEAPDRNSVLAGLKRVQELTAAGN